MNDIIKKNKGVTLLALVITVVVLVILATTAIASIKKDSIISQANGVVDDYNDKLKVEDNNKDKLLGILKEEIGGDIPGEDMPGGDITGGNTIGENTTGGNTYACQHMTTKTEYTKLDASEPNAEVQHIYEKKCTECGETVEGDRVSHKYSASTGKCTECGWSCSHDFDTKYEITSFGVDSCEGYYYCKNCKKHLESFNIIHDDDKCEYCGTGSL